jgi:hypothetical protein
MRRPIAFPTQSRQSVKPTETADFLQLPSVTY